MARNWLRIKNRNVDIDHQDNLGFFSVVKRFGNTGGGFVLTNDNSGTRNYYDGLVLGDVDYDLGFMKLPAATKRIWYQLDAQGLLAEDTLDPNNGATLTEEFLGMVLMDVQPTGGVSEYFLGGTDIDMNLCKSYNWDTQPNWGAHHHCGIKFTNPTTGNGSAGSRLTGSETPIFWAQLALKGDEDTTHPGYYLIPFLLPEKLVAYYAVKADSRAFNHLNTVWFNKIVHYNRNYTAQVDPFIAVEIDEYALQRSDEHALHFVLEGETALNPTLDLACVSKQNGIISVF